MFAEGFPPTYGVSGEAATEPQMVWEAPLSGLMRAATTDDRALLEMIRQRAEHARTAAAEQAR